MEFLLTSGWNSSKIALKMSQISTLMFISQLPLLPLFMLTKSSDGHIMPVYVHRSSAVRALRTSTSVPPSPVSSYYLESPFLANKNQYCLLGRWRKSSKRIFRKCFGFVKPLCQTIGRSRKSSRVDDLERKVCEIQSWSNSLEASPRPSSAYSVVDWSDVKRIGGHVDLHYGLKKAKSWRSSPRASPRISPSRSSSACCDVESSIHEAILYCKRSIGQKIQIVTYIKSMMKLRFSLLQWKQGQDLLFEHIRLKELYETINLAKAMQKELEMLIWMKEREATNEDEDKEHGDMSKDRFSKFMKDNQIEVEFQESMSLNIANAIMSKLRFQLEPFRVITDENSPWEEKSAAKRLADKMQKYRRNKLWRRRKRKRIAENLSREHEQFDQIDKEADEWRAREIAKDIAQRKVEKMNEIAKQKAKEEKKRLEAELELVLIVEKLQELRSIRIQKLKKQGHFLPEEDDKFLERVRAAVEEEERQSMAAAFPDAAKDAIATAEESRKHIQSHAPEMEEPGLNNSGDRQSQDQENETANERVSNVVAPKESGKVDTHGPSSSSVYDSVANLPMEFYHYYHGSNTDMGTLIEVRRTWDAYIRPGGRLYIGMRLSILPGNWSYLLMWLIWFWELKLHEAKGLTLLEWNKKKTQDLHLQFWQSDFEVAPWFGGENRFLKVSVSSANMVSLLTDRKLE
ncbi:UNVERIFIED_CONTAM: U11/U12 small nuclear ribonucleoprotein [Sesamum radiatum]|uniref:U11/U12 small nuclear ribonucleoprotein n=1 Tax=Sesamum radiatum TaxID=300843 RepID=A0AAW2VGA0_SESRA